MTVDGRQQIATLSSFVPQAVLRRIAATPTLTDEPDAARFPAALLLVDITGFTRLTAAAVRRGPAATEQLSRSLNTYLGQIIELVADHGGDVSKILGDALLPMWPATQEDLATVTRRAALCGLAIVTTLGELELEDDLRLSIKVGLCAGDVAATHVGGLDRHWLFLLAGEAVAQLSPLEAQMQSLTVVASPEAWALTSSHFVGQQLDQGHVRILPVRADLPSQPLATVVLEPGREEAVRAYIPVVCLSRIDAGQADWLAELRRTTVVFAGVHGLGSATPDAVQLLHRVTQTAQRVLAKYDGWLKEITMDEKGTTLVAAFGVPPFTHEDDPVRAVQAALILQAEVRALGLATGVGVATGSAICGPVGNARRRDFAVLGQHVNLASRLMQASGDDRVLCDADTQADARSRLSFERLPSYVLKGMTGPIDVYRVRGADSPDRRASALIDRTAEIAAATAAIDAVKSGRGDLVLLEGEAGIGKSRLIDEWLRRAAGAGVTSLTGAAAAIEGSTPYHAWRSIFEELFGLEGITDLAARQRLVLGRLQSDEDARRAPLLESVLSADLRDNEVTTQMNGAVRADNTRDLLIRVLQLEASARPLLIVIEDAHWLDSASWALALRARAEVPSLLLVITMRPIAAAASDPIAAMRPDITTRRLGALSREDARALACERTGALRIADSVAAIVDQRAEGNPLFIEHLTYAMRDSGRIVVENGLCRPATGMEDLNSSIIPDTVQRVITTRLDQLPPAEAMTLKVASVIGQRFALRTLEDIYPLSTDTKQLVGHLNTLTRLDLVAQIPSSPEPTYQFKHVITQEVAYNLMLSAQLQQLHQKLAEWYERTYADDLSPFHAFLAHHWKKAGIAARAIDHLERAGAQALETFANEEAIGFLEQAVALEAEAHLGLEPPRRARWELQLGEAYVHMSKYREGREHLEAGLRLMNLPVPSGPRQQVLRLTGELLRQILRRSGLHRKARPLTDPERDRLVATFRAYERLAEASYYGRETLLPLYCVIRILNEAEASGIPAEIARGYAGTGALFGLVPLPKFAEWYLNKSLRWIDQVDDLTTKEIVGIVVGFYYIGAGKWDIAREQLRMVRRIAGRLGDRRRLDDVVGNLMELEALQGSFTTAVNLADELVGSAGARNDRRFWAEGLAGKAYASWQLGKSQDAMSALGALKALVIEEGDLPDEVKIKHTGVLTVINQSRGDKQQALVAAEDAMGLTAKQRPAYYGTFHAYSGPADVFLSFWESGLAVRDGRRRATEALTRLRTYAAVFPIGRPRSSTLEGRYRWLIGETRRAHQSWRRAVASAQALSMPYEQALAYLEIGRHLDPSDAGRNEYLRKAKDIFTRLNASHALAAAEIAALVGAATL